MRSSLIFYLFRYLITERNLRLLRGKLFQQHLKLVNWERNSHGFLFVSPIFAFSRALIPSHLVNVHFEIHPKIGNKTVIKRKMKLGIDFEMPFDKARIGKNDMINIFGFAPVNGIVVKKIQKLSLKKSHLERPISVRLNPIFSVNKSDEGHDLNREIEKFFNEPRIYYSGDFISIDRREEFHGAENRFYFKLDTPISPCIIDRKCTVYQTSDVKSLLPYSAQIRTPAFPGNLEKVIDKGMEIIFANDKLENSSPISLLICGPSGSGKRLAVHGIAIRTHRNLITADGYELWNELAAQTEQKLKNLFLKADAHSPSILFITNADLLGFDQHTSTADDRIISSLFAECEIPRKIVIIFGCKTKKLASLSPALTTSILYTLPIEAMNEIDRNDYIQKIFPKTIDSTRLAKQTTGFLVAELNSLLYDSRFHAKSNAKTRMENSDVEWAIDKRNASFADAIGAPKIPSVSWEDVGGLEETKALIRESIDSNLRQSNGLRRSGIILYGPPGCGKTLLAKAVATEYKIAFLSVKGPELLNKYVGQSEENLRNVFERARAAAPCVIFFDELDSLAPNRGRAGDSGGVMDRIVSQLLAELDALHLSPHKVFVMAATNRADLLDPSLRTPGRFDKVVNVRVGNDVESRRRILEALSRKTRFSKDVRLQEIAALCSSKMSGADLYSVISNATMIMLRETIQKIEIEKVEERDAEVLVTNRHLKEAVAYVNEQKEAVTGAVRAADLIE